MRRSLEKRNIRIFALLMAVVLILLSVPSVQAADASGSCGVGTSWTLEGGVLTVSGSGPMNDYSEYSPAPWSGYADSIRAVVVTQGVTNVGNFAFFALKQLTSVTLPTSVSKIGGWAFYGCERLQLLDLGTGVQEIGRSAFEQCYALTGVRLPASLHTLRYQAFYRCEGLVSITIPAGVTTFEAATFAYCTGLQNAKVLASVNELPRRTFYGCEALVSVSLAPAITEVGVNAYYDCEQLKETKHDAVDGDVSVSNSSTVKTENGSVTTQNSYTQTGSSTITSQTVTTQGTGGTSTQVQIDAVLDSAGGWSELNQTVGQTAPDAGQVQVDVHLKGEPVVSGGDIGSFAGQNVTLSIHTSQGAVWHIETNKISASELSENYDLSFSLRPLTSLSEAQSAAVGSAQSYGVVFNKTLDFKVEVELPLGKTLRRQTAVFFSPESGTFTRMQAVMIDNEGVAHFYLGYVEAGTEYLIGINVPKKDSSGNVINDVIIPSTMQGEYPNFVQMSDIEYIITGRKSSWGMNIWQVTGILVAVLVGCVIAVGAVMFAMNKRRLKAGYIPPMDEEEEE